MIGQTDLEKEITVINVNQEMSPVKVFHTVGYGGRKPSDFVALLNQHDVTLVVDVRLRPDRASIGAYVKAKAPDKGIEKLLGERNIGYLSIIELGNIFLDQEDWQARYGVLLEKAGDILRARLLQIKGPFCLLCAERKASDCHRKQIAECLVRKGYEAVNIE